MFCQDSPLLRVGGGFGLHVAEVLGYVCEAGAGAAEVVVAGDADDEDDDAFRRKLLVS